MLPYSFLVLGVDPTTNEANVPVDKKIVVSFAKPMSLATLNSNTIRLKKVNGEYVSYEGKYDHRSKEYTITPSKKLENGIQYQVIVVGGEEGVLSVDDNYLSATATYEFTTKVEKGSLPKIANLKLKQDYLFIHAEWEMSSHVDGSTTLPSSFPIKLGHIDPSYPLTDDYDIKFYVKLSHSKDPEASGVWPDTYQEGITISGSFFIPYKAEENKHYYVHVQGRVGDRKTNWVTSQIFIEEFGSNTGEGGSVVDPDEGDGANNPPTEVTPPSLNQLEVVDYGPKNDEIITPHEFIVVFNKELKTIEEEPEKDTPLHDEWIYIVEGPRKDNLSLFDLRGRYSYASSIGGKAYVDEDNKNMLVLSLEGVELAHDRPYTVVLSKETETNEGEKIGYTQVFGFTTEPEHFYGDFEHIKTSLGSYDVFPSDQFIQKLMKKYSQYVYDVWSIQTTFTPNEIPYYIHEYVNTQAMIDGFISTGISSKMGSNGGGSFTLGDLSISKGSGGGSSSEDDSGLSMYRILEQLKEQLQYWEDLIHGHNNRGYAKPGATVKGEGVSPYPEYLTRSTLVEFDS